MPKEYHDDDMYFVPTEKYIKITRESKRARTSKRVARRKQSELKVENCLNHILLKKDLL